MTRIARARARAFPIPCNTTTIKISESSLLCEDLVLDDVCLHEVLQPPGSLNTRHLECYCQNGT